MRHGDKETHREQQRPIAGQDLAQLDPDYERLRDQLPRAQREILARRIFEGYFACVRETESKCLAAPDRAGARIDAQQIALSALQRYFPGLAESVAEPLRGTGGMERSDTTAPPHSRR